MRKTSVYLPETLKRRLRARSEASGRSEAELIRASIEAALEQSPTPSATADPPVPGRLVGVGVGPGSPDLLTVRALAALRRADRVLAPTTASVAVGRAEQIVRQAAPDVALDRVEFVMAADHAARAGALGVACDLVTAHLAAGEEVAFITLGDPNTYSTFGSVAAGVRARRPDTPVVTVPGIMAFQALATEAGVDLVDEEQSLVLLAARAGDAEIDAALADPTRTVVLYKGGARLGALADRLERAGRLDGAVLGELLGMNGERVAAVADVRDRAASYLSSIIVPASDGAGPVPEPR
ncbi:MAG: precorrin-2 C(20)-methyltransferase [Actinomycetota bacterium]|nr:precorrin-2 C(20)-methyltransferase [Actinomycetota bacterium]